MDYYAANVALPATSFISPPSISGEPPHYWTANSSDPDEWMRIRQAQQQRQQGTTAAPVAVSKQAEDHTGALVEAGGHVQGSRFVDTTQSELDRIARHRAQIIALRFSGENQSSEVVARLEILNRRLTHQMPRVTMPQVAALEEAAETLSALDQAREERIERLHSLLQG